MPQITVDYPDTLADAFDRRGFARALHPLVVELADAKLDTCKSRFRRTEDNVAGGADRGHAVVHIEIGLLAGRTPEVKATLTGAVLELVAKYLDDSAEQLHLSAEVRDLDASYTKA
ncbi:5-carboxymethyl-2-hydroxymuconate Delta-isomerase [Streptomyces sp. NBC_01304]|uniref:5-carboxymethyl-2-hydroxymuconate Delta-isomerase n=1 Tax=Streptomyces sp. NBC_01304 TaxID=2903818 RepID=UPI002E0EDF94|nr:isomerase [Streptomyces sp. NBC_01304]